MNENAKCTVVLRAVCHGSETDLDRRLLISWFMRNALCTLPLLLRRSKRRKFHASGFLSGTRDLFNPRLIESFQAGSQALGYTEGKNIHVEYRYITRKRELIPSLWRLNSCT